MTREEKNRFLKVRIQSVDTRLYLTRTGEWTRLDRFAAAENLSMDPVEAIRLCLRLGIKNVRFTPDQLDSKSAVSVYPFGGDPAEKAYRKQIRRQLAEDRRIRSQHRALQAKIRLLEAAQRQTL